MQTLPQFPGSTTTLFQDPNRGRERKKLFDKRGTYSSLHDKVGKFFHSVSPAGEIEWQGQVLAEPVFGRFEVQLYDWVLGDESDVLLVPAAVIKDWRFYDSAEAMRAAYERFEAAGGPVKVL